MEQCRWGHEPRFAPSTGETLDVVECYGQRSRILVVYFLIQLRQDLLRSNTSTRVETPHEDKKGK
jgi:hypothetical protein